MPSRFSHSTPNNLRLLYVLFNSAVRAENSIGVQGSPQTAVGDTEESALSQAVISEIVGKHRSCLV